MGDHGVWAQSSGLVLNGLLHDETANATLVLDTDRWHKAEEQTAKLIARLQPNQSSEERRSAVANYVQRLITNCLSCKVFTFGSVPLKTYLPDGDIDLTAFSDNDDLKDTWATTVCSVLENEAKSENADFCVKEVKFIQAEVKLIKCLVENIVVDISFNQVGGLCTLCFLEEMDKVISRNHLFKRSIILIKAWCYYESRILGAHHGLISTYALEALVLYIFHVFNNSFAGPLEVLYRFLELFSNFDWDNYCVSLWGPVPISSLPDMTAEPPRTDNGKLLFNKVFLDNRTAVYSVVPVGQENQSQPFVSKHFNVVDPLRTNNNLGRSVSKGNFFRIRSAFTFGSKMLTRLLECPKDAIVSEVNQFFTNTWKRHGTGDRPDILCLDLQPLQPVKTVQVDESSSLKISGNDRNKFENGVLHTSEEHLAETGQSSHNAVSEVLSNHHNVYGSNNQAAVSIVQNQMTQRKQSNSRFTDQLERSHRSSGFGQNEKSQKNLKPNYSISDQEQQGRFQFTRTRSSSELTDTSDFSRGSSDRALEAAKEQTPAKFSTGSRRKNLGSDAAGSHSSKSSLDDYVSPRQISSQKNVEVASDVNTSSNSHHDDFIFTNTREELDSVSETLEMQQEEQDLVNMMGSSNVHSFNGQITLPMHVAPLSFPFVSTSMDYFTRNLAGVVPSNLPIVGTPWGPSVQFAQGLASFPVPHYFHAPTYNSKVDPMTEPFNDGSAVMELNLEDCNRGNWHEDDDVIPSKGFNPSGRYPLDDGQQKLECTITSSSTTRSTNFDLLSQKYSKSSKEDRSLAEEDFPGSFLSKTDKEGEIPAHLRSSNANPVRLPQAISSRIKYASEDHRNQSANTSKSTKDRWGRESASPSVSTSVYGKENSRLQLEGSSENAFAEVDGIADRVPLSTMGSDIPERISESASLASSSGYEPSENQSDPLIPFAPLLVGTSQQRAFDCSKFVFPLVPYFVVPFGNLTSNTGNPDGYVREFDGEEESGQFQITSSDHNIDSVESPDLSEVVRSPTISRNCGSELSEELTPDILNSDLNGHRQNLVYGRFCQNSYHAPFMYSTHVVGSPIYFSTHFPLGESGRSVPSNVNNKKIVGHSPRVAPVIPVQSGPALPTGAFHRNVDEAPRYRGGTGTYLPNPVSHRDRHSNSRNNRGNRNHERNDYGDRPRVFYRGHGRSQVERTTFHSDRLAAAKNQEEKRWTSRKHEHLSSQRGADRTFPSTTSSNNLENITSRKHGVVLHDQLISPVVLMYPCDQGVGNGSSEPLDFASRALYQSSDNGTPSISERFAEGELYEQRHGSSHRGGSSRSSPGGPSSPN